MRKPVETRIKSVQLACRHELPDDVTVLRGHSPRVASPLDRDRTGHSKLNHEHGAGRGFEGHLLAVTMGCDDGRPREQIGVEIAASSTIGTRNDAAAANRYPTKPTAYEPGVERPSEMFDFGKFGHGALRLTLYSQATRNAAAERRLGHLIGGGRRRVGGGRRQTGPISSGAVRDGLTSEFQPLRRAEPGNLRFSP